VWDPSTVVLKLLVRCHPRALYKEALAAAGGDPAADAGGPAQPGQTVPTVVELDTESGSLLIGYVDGLVLYLEHGSAEAGRAASPQPRPLPPTPGSEGAGSAAPAPPTSPPSAAASNDSAAPPAYEGGAGRRASTGKFVRVFTPPATPLPTFWHVAIASTLNKAPVNAIELCAPWQMYDAGRPRMRRGRGER